jgi:hypothetical protein
MNFTACTIARAEGTHLGEAQTGVGPWVSVSLCGIRSSPFLGIYWKTHASVTMVTCATCYARALAIHEGHSDGMA